MVASRTVGKSNAAGTLDALENGSEKVLADEQTKALKRSLSTEQAYYLKPSKIA